MNFKLYKQLIQLNILRKINMFKVWLNHPPKNNRSIIGKLLILRQSLFPCKHPSWEYLTRYIRICKFCGKMQLQKLKRHNKGSLWIDVPSNFYNTAYQCIHTPSQHK